jgi:putative transposase
MAFIDDMKASGHAVESTCRVLTEHGCQVAARTYRSWRQSARRVATRTVSDAVLIDALISVQGTPEGLYGRRKMTRWLRRQGHQVAFCTTDRLMRDLGMNGVRRGKGVRTTVPTKDGNRAGDLLDRDFTAAAPNQRWVADFTYCRTWAGFAYVAFIVDVYAQRIVGWQAATTKATDLVLTPLRIALWDRDRQGRPVEPGQLLHHSDAGSQYTSIRFTEHLELELHRTIDRVGRGRLRQRLNGIDHRLVQDRGHHHDRLPRRPLQDPRRRRVRDRRLGRLVQPPTPARIPRLAHPGRVRAGLLRCPQSRAATRIGAAEKP